MKLLLCVHGFPDELFGGTELAARFLARGLLRRGHEVVVVAGSLEHSAGGELGIREEVHQVDGARYPLKVIRLSRPDLYFDHWHKSKSAQVARCLREILAREAPDVVHVLHWIRLTRDLVSLAAQAGVPAVVSLNDSWVSCPLVHRVESLEQSICEKSLSGTNCIPCAGRIAPRTPWVPLEAAFMELGARSQDIAAELSLARAVLVPTRSFGERQLRFLGEFGPRFEPEPVPPAAPPVYASQPQAPAAPGPGQALVLGSWGQHSDLKGSDLAFQALELLGASSGVELVLAGREAHPGYLDGLRVEHPNANVRWEGAFDMSDLDSHPVSAVHAMLSTSRAPESFGLVLEEARALGMPALLPDSGAFAERGGEERGALLFETGSAAAIAAAIAHLRDSPAALEDLRGAVPAPLSEDEVLGAHLAIYERARLAGAPDGAGEPQWFAERMQNFSEQEWDRRLAEHSLEELGIAPPPEG